jgi:hypothetical protein
MIPEKAKGWDCRPSPSKIRSDEVNAMQTLSEVTREVQALSKPRINLSVTERRLLLAAALRLFLRRIRHNLPIHKSELLHLVACADDDVEVVA